LRAAGDWYRPAFDSTNGIPTVVPIHGGHAGQQCPVPCGRPPGHAFCCPSDWGRRIRCLPIGGRWFAWRDCLSAHPFLVCPQSLPSPADHHFAVRSIVGNPSDRMDPGSGCWWLTHPQRARWPDRRCIGRVGFSRALSLAGRKADRRCSSVVGNHAHPWFYQLGEPVIPPESDYVYPSDDSKQGAADNHVR
jgi:hypothetical protein